MSLKPCVDCKREISISAARCPHCGSTSPHSSLSDILKGIVFFVVLGIIIYVIANIF